MALRNKTNCKRCDLCRAAYTRCAGMRKRSHVSTQYCVCIIIYSNIIVISTFICAVSSCLILLRCSAEHLQGFTSRNDGHAITDHVPRAWWWRRRHAFFDHWQRWYSFIYILVFYDHSLQQLPFTGPRNNPNAGVYRLQVTTAEVWTAY